MTQPQSDQPDDLDEARLERALHHAFVGADLLTPPPGLDAAVAAGRDGSREQDELPAGVVLQGRYRIDATLARGGIGVLFAARDLVLERPVAVKVLQHRHRRRASLVQRLLREAEIGAQLQHPGIVPVHDVGATPDGRPFVAMKLVQGRTFAELLAGRGSPDTERARMLGVFAGLCQTMAYVHAGGVVHRDLKPANVMVGAFGEVQVMDWGMAKAATPAPRDEPPPTSRATGRNHVEVPADAASTSGGALGTWAYMPPEQARCGATASGAPADVFSLGAILCEILTGSPPYGIGAPDEIRHRAEAGDVSLARSSLSACNAEPEIVKLCLHCLEPEPSTRPAHAGVLAEAMSRHLAAVEDRAHRAELTSAKAEARALAERRTRRWQFLLFGSLLALTASTAVLLSWQAQQRHLRSAHATSVVDSALADARAIQARLLVGGGDVAGWAELITAAQAACALATSPDADDATRQRAVSFRDEVEIAHAGELRRRTQQQEDHRMRERLRTLHTTGGSDWQWDRLHAGYREAFRDYGIDCEQLSEDEIVRAIRASAIAADLIHGLSDWNMNRKQVGVPEPLIAGLGRLLEVLDDDPLRRRIRAIKERGDLDAQRELAANIDVEHTSPSTLRQLASGLDLPSAIALVRRAQAAHPGDFWLNFSLGQLLSATGTAELHETVRFFSNALALVPDSVGAAGNLSRSLVVSGQSLEAERVLVRVLQLHPREEFLWFNLGRARESVGNYAEALRAFEEAARLGPRDGDNQQALARALRKVGRTVEAEAVFRAGIEQNPEHVDLVLSYGAMLCDQLARPGEAVAVFERAIELAPDRADCHRNLGLALRRLGRLDAAERCFRAAGERDPESAMAWLEIGKICHEQRRYADARDAYRAAVARDPGNWRVHHLLGDVLDELGDEGAIAAYREACRLSPRAIDSWHNLGLALLNRGELAAAETALRTAIMVAPDHTSARFLLGKCLLAQDRPGEAAPVFQALVDNTDRAQTADFVMLGQALSRSGAFAAAEAAFATAIEREPTHVGAREGLDQVRQRLGDKRGPGDRK